MDSVALNARLRRVRPTGVVVVADDGTEHEIALRPGGRRWQAAAGSACALLERHGGHVELRDEDGAVLDTWTDGAPVEPGEGEEAEAARHASALEALVALNLRAQQQAVEQVVALVRPVLDAHVELSRVMTSRIAVYEQTLARVQRTIARGEQADSDGAASASDTLMQIVGALASQRMGVPEAPPGKDD